LNCARAGKAAATTSAIVAARAKITRLNIIPSELVTAVRISSRRRTLIGAIHSV
jgi:hypothetical protein